MEYNFKAENRHILVAFGDITAFSNWAKRSTTSSEDFKKFIVTCHNRFLQLREKGFYVKLFSDGLMIIDELKEESTEEQICSFMRDCFSLYDDIDATINNLHYPRPTGFRIRLAKGEAWKLKSEDGKEVDYIGYIVNMTFRFLSIYKGIPMLAHESIRDSKSKKKDPTCTLNFERTPPPPNDLTGVDREDICDLWTVTRKKLK